MSDYKSAAEMIEFQAAELRNRDEALARVVRERDAAIRRADRAEALLAEARTEHRDISERYIAASSARVRDEALLREIAAVPLVGLTLGSVLLAKIREALS